MYHEIKATRTRFISLDINCIHLWAKYFTGLNINSHFATQINLSANIRNCFANTIYNIYIYIFRERKIRKSDTGVHLNLQNQNSLNK